MSEPEHNGERVDTPLGSLPNSWRVVRLAEVTEEGNDRNNELAFGRPDVLGVDNVTGLGASERTLGNDFRRYKLVRRLQFAYNPMRLNVGSIGLWREPCTRIVSPDYIVFGCKEDQLDPEFLDLFRDSAAWRAQIRQSGQGSVRIRYYYRHIADFFVPLPPLPEQRAIAHVLRTVQQAKETTARVLAAARQLKQSLMRHLFTYGPVPFDQADQVLLKETEVGPVPEHWETVRLGDVARIGNGSTPKRTNASYWKNGSIPWITSGKVHERIIRKADEFVTDAALQECHLPLVPQGSVVVAITGQGKTLGNAAMVDLDTCVSQHLAYIQFTDSRILAPFVLAFLRQRYDHLRQISTGGGSTKGALTCGFLKGYSIPYPPTEEQRCVCRQLEAVEQWIDCEQKRFESLELLFQSLLHHLMTGKVRVHALPAFATAGGKS